MTRYITNPALQELYEIAKVDSKENASSGLCNAILTDTFKSAESYIVFPQYTQNDTRPDFIVRKMAQRSRQFVTIAIVEAKSALSSQSYETSLRQMRKAVRDGMREFPEQRGMWGAIWKGTKIDIYIYARVTDEFTRMNDRPLDVKQDEERVALIFERVKTQNLFGT